jgi:hypothetical protein
MKSYTDIEQSKKLAEILPMESADMRYDEYTSHIDGTPKVGYKEGITEGIPCWSLAALLDILPNNEHIETNISRGSWKIDTVEYVPNTWWCEYEDTKNQTEFNISADNPIDACVEMIIKLHEKKLL